MKKTYQIEVDCANCANLMEEAAKKTEGVANATVNFMTQKMIDFICNWEVESYRSKVSLAGAAALRLQEKIAIVTGSAQGFGQGIADEMLKQGANVVIADLN